MSKSQPEVVVDVGDDTHNVQVIRTADSTYDVVSNGVVRHPHCDAESAMRALGHYLHGALLKVEIAQPPVGAAR